MSLMLIALAHFAAISFTHCDDTAAIEKALQEKVSFEANNASMAEVFDLLAKHVQGQLPDFEIVILGKDLQTEGITRNQRIGKLDLDDKSLAEVLTAITTEANPNRNAKSPADPQMKLIWVIGPDPQNPQRKVVLITTRAAAAQRGDKLPDAFKPPA